MIIDHTRFTAVRTRELIGLVGLVCGVLLGSSPALADTGADQLMGPRPWPTYSVATGSELSTVYFDGSELLVETMDNWKLVCGSNPLVVTDADLKAWADNHYRAMAAGPVRLITGTPRTGTLNIVFAADGSVPAEAIPALQMAATYLDSLFNNPITVTITVNFQNMGGGGVIGATSPSYVPNVPYTTVRPALVAGMDSDDVIQTWLPTTNYVRVRYNGSSDTVTNENYVDFTRANYRAAIGSINGNAAAMTYNTQFSFDFDPTNGVPATMMSFVDVVCHETGHALGFVSGADNFTGVNFTSLDLFRFQRTDGCCNYNPDTYADFQSGSRLVSNNLPDDQHISDLIVAEYRMSDGNPAQASHFRDQIPRIGLLAPYFSNGESYYPEFYFPADKAMFDAIGYYYPPCVVPLFTLQPVDTQTVCPGTTVQMSAAVNISNPAYQWRIGFNNLVDDGVHVFGATTATLQLVNVLPADSSAYYNCLVTNQNDGCLNQSNSSNLTVLPLAAISSQPVNKTITEYENADFHITAVGATPLTYRWRHNGVNLNNGGGIFGALTPNLLIATATADRAGWYDCVVNDACGHSTTSTAAHLIVNTGLGAGRGDLNCDGLVNFDDINPFVLALSSGEAEYYNQFPNCHFYNADANSDGGVNFDDINPFVECLSNGSCP